MPHITESHIEEAALKILDDLGYKILHGPDGENPNEAVMKMLFWLNG